MISCIAQLGGFLFFFLFFVLRQEVRVALGVQNQLQRFLGILGSCTASFGVVHFHRKKKIVTDGKRVLEENYACLCCLHAFISFKPYFSSRALLVTETTVKYYATMFFLIFVNNAD